MCVCIYIFRERDRILSSCLMRLWELSSPSFAGQASRLENQGGDDVAVLSLKTGDRILSLWGGFYCVFS